MAERAFDLRPRTLGFGAPGLDGGQHLILDAEVLDEHVERRLYVGQRISELRLRPWIF